MALPTIGRDLGIDASSSVWIVNAYQVAIMSSIIGVKGLSKKYVIGHQHDSAYRTLRDDLAHDA